MATGNLQTQDRVMQPVKAHGIPPLRHGDRLSRDEFERRYNAMPDVKKAELIEGRVHMPSPVRWKNHGEPENQMSIWLGVYRVFTPGVFAANNSTVRLDQSNEPQPDVALRIGETSGGQTLLDPDGYLEGAPELVAEIAASSAPSIWIRNFRSIAATEFANTSSCHSTIYNCTGSAWRRKNISH
jgi:hypothetical protein